MAKTKVVLVLLFVTLYAPRLAFAQAAETAAAAEEPGVVAGGIRWVPHAQARLRTELRSDFPNIAEDFLHLVTSRIRLGVKAQWRSLDVFVQMQDVRLWGQQPPIPFDNGEFLGLHQGYANIGGDLGFVRAGRQEVEYGDQRLIGALNWSSNGRSFDGLRLHGNFAGGSAQLDAFGAVTSLQTEVSNGFTIEQSEGSYLGALYFTWTAGEAFLADVYVLYRHDGPVDDNLEIDNDIFAFGTRLDGKVGGLDVTAEATIQTGDTAEELTWDFFAWAVSGDVSYDFGGDWHPTVRGGAALASGESGDTNELNNFFPTNHGFYGIADLIGLRNLTEGHLRFSMRIPTASLRFYVEYLQLALQTADGRWSSSPGVTISRAVPDADRNLGSELDLWIGWAPLPGIDVTAGYAAFLPASGAEDRGFADTMHFGYLTLDLHTP